MRVRNLRLLFVLLLLAGGLTCEPTPTPTPVPSTTPAHTPLPSPTPHLPVTLRWNLGAEPQSIDPALASSDAEVDVARQLFVGLTAYAPQTGEPIPDLATHWDVGDGGQVYTFHLRSDVQWMRYDADAARMETLRPVTAHDVVYSLRRAVDPATESDDAYLLCPIRNAEAIRTTPLTDTYDLESLGVTAVDDYTVQVTLERPIAYLPAILASPVAWPVPRQAIEEYGKLWTEPRFIITNGPYVLTKWIHNDHLILTKNPLYYAADSVQIERVECAMIEGSLDVYERREVDTIWLPPWYSFRDRIAARGPDLHIQTEPGTFYYIFDITRPPFDDVHVRRAFSFAIDRQAVVDRLEDGKLPANSIFSPALPNTPTQPDPLFDPQRAREELALAGYAGGEGFPGIVFFRTLPRAWGVSLAEQGAAEALGEMWREHLGITNVETTEIVHRLYLYEPPAFPQPHMWRAGWYAEYWDPADVSCVAWLWAYDRDIKAYEVHLDQSDPVVQRLDQVLAGAAAELDPVRRQALYREADRLLCVDLCIVVPVFHYNEFWLTKPYLHRDYPALGGQNFKDWRIDPH